MSSGPVLIFDKSSLEALSVDEACWLDNFYRTNITPLFLIETLADLEKEVRQGRSPEQVVGSIARKTPVLGALPNVYHLTLCIGELLGEKIQMRGIPLIAGFVPTVTGDKKGLLLKRMPELEAFERWQQSEFLEVERQFARQWRRSLSALDLDASYRTVQPLFAGQGKPRSLPEVKSLVEELLRGTDRRAVLNCALGLLGVPEPHWSNILSRWDAEGNPGLEDFAPYTAHVLEVNLFFYLGIGADIISRERPSNKVDLAYLYYLPFCMVFVSSDNLHARTVPLFLGPDQEFIRGTDLKADLKRLDEHYAALPDTIKDRGIMTFATHPPREGAFLLTRLWDHFLPGWRSRADQEIPRTKQVDAKVLALIKQLSKETKEAGPATPMDPDGADYVTIQRRVPLQRGKWRILPPEVEGGSPAGSGHANE